MLALALTALLSQVVADDFETSTLTGWDATPCGSQSLAPSTLAAHRGQRGLRLEDTSTTETCTGAVVKKALPMNVRDLYSRAWVRLVKSNASGDIIAIHAAFEPMGAAAHSWQIDFQNQLKVIEQPQFADGGRDYVATQTGRSLGDGGWALLEACTLNRGSANATVVYAIDGDALSRRTLPAFSSDYAFLGLGEVYIASGAFTGIVDFDDVRADARPQASRLVVTAAALKSNACSAITVSLSASLPAGDGGIGPAPLAPYDVALELTGTPFFRDDACATEETAPKIAKGSNAVVLYVRPASIGSLRLAATHPDFLPGGLDASVTDGGTGAAPKSLYALGCTSTGASPLFLCALLFLLKRPSGRTS